MPTVTTSISRYFDQLQTRLLNKAHEQQRQYANGAPALNRVSNNTPITVETAVVLRTLALRQIALIHATYDVDSDTATATNSGYASDSSGICVSLTRKHRVMAPAGLIAFTKLDVDTRTRNVPVLVVIQNYSTSTRRYTVSRLVQDVGYHQIESTGLIERNWSERGDVNIYVSRSMYLEWQLIATMLNDFLVSQGTDNPQSMTFLGLRNALRNKLYADNLPNQNQRYACHVLDIFRATQFGSDSTIHFGLLTAALQSYVNSCPAVRPNESAPRLRNYMGMREVSFAHSQNMTQFQVWRHARVFDSYDALNRREVHSEGTNFRPAGRPTPRVLPCYTTFVLSSSKRRQVINTINRTKAINYHIDRLLKLMLKYNESEHLNGLVQLVTDYNNVARLIGTDASYIMYANALLTVSNKFPDRTFPTLIKCVNGIGVGDDVVSIVTDWNSAGVPRSTHKYTTLSIDPTPAYVPINGLNYLRDSLFEWDDGTYHLHAEPEAIKGYHQSKDWVGFIPSQVYKKGPFLGLELELENSGKERNVTIARRALQAANEEFGTVSKPYYLSCEGDGSLSSGFEMVTGFTGLDVHAVRIMALLDAVRPSMKPMSSCGIHVHICKDGASLRHQARIDRFINSQYNVPLIDAVARRTDTRYARRLPNNKAIRSVFPRVKEIKDIATRSGRTNIAREFKNNKEDLSNRLGNGDRYRMVNFNNRRTMEFRLFASSTDYVEVMTALEFTYNLWWFCKERKNEELFTSNFLKFISEPSRRAETKNLRTYLSAKGYDVFMPKTKKQPLAATA